MNRIDNNFMMELDVSRGVIYTAAVIFIDICYIAAEFAGNVELKSSNKTGSYLKNRRFSNSGRNDENKNGVKSLNSHIEKTSSEKNR